MIENKLVLVLKFDLKGSDQMENFVKVVVIENQFEAQVLESILEERGIPYFLKTYDDVAYGNLYQLHRGWGQLTAPERFKDEIVEIVNDLRNSPEGD